MIPANVSLPLLAVVTGWLALYPVRRELGPWFYHLLAFPTGALAWLTTTALTTLTRTHIGIVTVVAGHALLITIVGGLGFLFRDPRNRARVPLWSWAVWGVAATGVVLVLNRLRLTGLAFDSFMHYELSAIWLTRTGSIDPIIMGARGPIVPSIQAGTHFLGGLWTFTTFTVYSLTSLAVLFVLAMGVSFARLGWTWRTIASVVAVSLLGLTPMWVFHSFFVHTNMISATYVLLSIVALLAGAGFLTTVAPPAEGPWWLVAGVFTMGVAGARPDGLAYAVLPLILGGVLYSRRLVGRRSVWGLYAGFGALVLFVVGAVCSRYGLWHSDKLPGRWAAELIALAAILGAVTLLLPKLGAFGEWLSERGNAIRLLIAADLLVILPVTYYKRSNFALSASNMLRNFMFNGGWGFFWYAVAGIVALSFVFAYASGVGELERVLLFALGQFFAVAFLIRGLTHTGMLGWNDSFDRVALAMMPLAWLYCTMVVGGFLTGCRPGPRDQTQPLVAAE